MVAPLLQTPSLLAFPPLSRVWRRFWRGTRRQTRALVVTLYIQVSRTCTFYIQVAEQVHFIFKLAEQVHFIFKLAEQVHFIFTLAEQLMIDAFHYYTYLKVYMYCLFRRPYWLHSTNKTPNYLRLWYNRKSRGAVGFLLWHNKCKSSLHFLFHTLHTCILLIYFHDLPIPMLYMYTIVHVDTCTVCEAVIQVHVDTIYYVEKWSLGSDVTKLCWQLGVLLL